MAVFIVTLTVATIRPLPIAMTSTSAMPVTSLTGPTYSCADVREPHRNLHRSSVIEMTVLLPETAGKPKTSETEVRLSRRLFVFVVLGTLVVELVATWTTSKVDVSLVVPVVLVLRLGIVGLIAVRLLYLLFQRRAQREAARKGESSLGWERAPSPTYRRGFWVILVGTVVLIVVTVIWVLPLKMWAVEGAANRVAEQMLGTPANAPCQTSPSALNTVASLMSAVQICGSAAPDSTVWFQGKVAPYEANGIAEGLLFAPSGFGRIGPLCVKHLVGSWWAYYDQSDLFQGAGVGCLLGYSTAGYTP